jgi:hypothetical protein
MKRIWMPAACLLLPLSSAWPQAERIGSFDRQSIVIAYYRSPQFAAMMKERTAARDNAKKAGDTARVRELEQWGASAQEVAHKQLYGDEPLTNILDALEPALDSIRIALKVRTIVAASAAPAGRQVIDVTPQLLDFLKADEKTRGMLHYKPLS